jgi:Na+-driven multidrug efflux pump
MQLWVLSSMLVDSLAVSGQTLIAVHIGQDQPNIARQVSERLLQLGLGLGLLLTVVLGLASPWWPQLFTSDEGVLGQIKELVPLAVLPLPVRAAGANMSRLVTRLVVTSDILATCSMPLLEMFFKCTAETEVPCSP